jgi:hypothetical protein
MSLNRDGCCARRSVIGRPSILRVGVIALHTSLGGLNARWIVDVVDPRVVTRSLESHEVGSDLGTRNWAVRALCKRDSGNRKCRCGERRADQCFHDDCLLGKLMAFAHREQNLKPILDNRHRPDADAVITNLLFS